MRMRGLIWLAGACVVVGGVGAAVLVLPNKEQSLPASTSVAAVAPSQTKPIEPQSKVSPDQPESAAEPPVAAATFDVVRVEKTGEAVIAGRAVPGSEVAVKWNGKIVGTAVANAEGSFAIVPEKPLVAGTGALTLEATKNGKTTQSDGSVVVSVEAQVPVVVAKIDPATPTQVSQAGEDALPSSNVLLGAIDYDEQGNIVFSGKAPVGTALRLYIDNALAGETAADAGGAWNFKGTSAINVGTHILRADAVDAKGSVLSRAETPFMREDVTKLAVAPQNVAPAQPVQQQATGVPPATAPLSSQDGAPVVEVRRIVIQPGSNLWRISRQVYGKGIMYTLIFEANRAQIKNPNRVYPGQILTAPEKKG